MNSRPRATLVAASLIFSLVIRLSAAEPDPTPKAGSGNVKFKGKPAWGEAKPLEIKGGMSAGSPSEQKATFTPEVKADMGVVAVGVGAKVEVTSLPPDPKDQWVDKASLGGFKAEATPQASVTVRAGYAEVTATKTAPDKKVSGEVRFKARENQAYWGNSVKGAVQVADQAAAEFAPPKEEKTPAKPAPPPSVAETNAQIAAYNKTELELAKMTGKTPKLMEPLPVDSNAPAAAPAAPAERMVSGYMILPRPADFTDEDWQFFAKTMGDQLAQFNLGGMVQVGAQDVRIRFEKITEAAFNEQRGQIEQMGFRIQYDR